MSDLINAEYAAYRGYVGTFNYSDEDGCYWGKIQNADAGDLITYEGDTPGELYQSFKEAVDDYINFKRRKEKE